MSYQVLARKYRPRDFSTLIGQMHVSRALSNTLEAKRLHHAYLFSGTRGVGKTTVARILAKALNCEQGVTSSPCLQCAHCLDIEKGNHVDLIEVDAASKTKVEDIREILDNVQYMPTRGRYKIYLIDEVHMLSNHSFNALLKTLEEPPEYVKFLFATTNPEKLPATVLSRCMQFHLKNILAEDIVGELGHILEKEGLQADESALKALAQAAKGSMRDALSLLDQAIAFSPELISQQAVADMLGLANEQLLARLLNALADKDANALLESCQAMLVAGVDFYQALDSLIAFFHELSVKKLGLASSSSVFLHQSNFSNLQEKFSHEQLQLLYQIALKGREDLNLANALHIGFEMVMLRMLTFYPLDMEISGVSSLPVSAQQRSESTTVRPPLPIVEVKSAPVPQLESVVISDSPTQQPLTKENWGNFLSQLKLKGAAYTLLNHAEFINFNEKTLNLRLEKGHISMVSTNIVSRIEEAIEQYLKTKIKIAFNFHDEAVASIAREDEKAQQVALNQAQEVVANDATLAKIAEKVGGKIIENSVRPIKS